MDRARPPIELMQSDSLPIVLQGPAWWAFGWYMYTGFLQASMSKIQGLFKEI